MYNLSGKIKNFTAMNAHKVDILMNLLKYSLRAIG